MRLRQTVPTLILPKALQGLVSAITCAQSLEELSAALRVLPEKCHMNNVVYYFAGSDGNFLNPDGFTCTTYPREWQERYYNQNYLLIDPVVQRGLHNGLPFEWRDLKIEKGTPGYSLLMEGRDYSLGHAALSIPLLGVDGSRGLFAITSDDPHKFEGLARVSCVRDYQMLANYVHEAYLRITAFETRGMIDLSEEEKNCLKLAAEGLLGHEIARKLKLSDPVVRLCLRVARHKLGAATTEMAILNANQFGVI
ncbi:Transcriptional activator protein raiR [Acetobacter malorum]|uniref:Transcriptional activator protein raiR n=1 Tax=Acetobacter malorum TaxID=178901 RepID=A0A177GDY5_9PROT|nr:autoinducer binding domain-containing protein [Acetobacter malorum]OAG74933.1 Transcriptional activator protein raiR [Acetobacter malorum]OAG78458.1 Transcriptional activator protein raiR [Acetobacter malorum]